MEDDIAKNGIRSIKDVPYEGKFTISYYSRKELEMLQEFFSVRSNKFDMKLLAKREALLKKLTGESETDESIDN